MENKDMTIITGSLEKLKGEPDLIKAIFNSTLDRIPEGYSLKSVTYEKGNKEFNYGLKLVSTKNN